MAVGEYYIDIDASGLTELANALEQTAGGVKDLSKLYRTIGKKAEWYVKTHQPIYTGSPKDSKTHPPPGFMQSRTKGGGGKAAWVSVSKVDYLIMQEFGGASYWHRYGAGAGRAVARKVRPKGGYSGMTMTGSRGSGHIIYKKPRKKRGYFIWNVAYRLRSYIGEQLTTGILDIGAKHGLGMEVTDKNLDIEQKNWNRAA